MITTQNSWFLARLTLGILKTVNKNIVPANIRIPTRSRTGDSISGIDLANLGEIYAIRLKHNKREIPDIMRSLIENNPELPVEELSII